MYICVNVQSDEFVDYDAIALQLCELSVSATLYPPAALPLVNSSWTTVRSAVKGYFAQKHNLLFPELQFESELAGIAPEGLQPLEGGEPCLQQEGGEVPLLGSFRVESQAVRAYCRKGIAVGKGLGRSRLEAGALICPKP